MAQNHARKNQPHARRKTLEPRVPAWVWLFTGCILGAFIMFLMRLSEMDPIQKIGRKPSPSSSESPKTDIKTPATPRFVFYDILKENDVTIPDFMKESPLEIAPETPSVASEEEYILQVASFKNPKDAEQLQVQLILLNLEAHIEKARIRNGETWHRVLVGPFESRSQREKARSTLVSNQYEALVLKRTPNHSSP
ncbi:SPOR domain-containing protein [Teredinibacter purpureus]|uniref:SPOR domain-containing protein n=1 Tax=Teredinibacter purpureus TaxID=2731756 RepID=UPI0005F7ED8E|nr:SPOR domain-containing protein [Teredinibacter purpureus]